MVKIFVLSGPLSHPHVPTPLEGPLLHPSYILHRDVKFDRTSNPLVATHAGPEVVCLTTPLAAVALLYAITAAPMHPATACLPWLPLAIFLTDFLTDLPREFLLQVRSSIIYSSGILVLPQG